MKKKLGIILLLGILFVNIKIEKKEEEELRSIFISYIELSEQLKGKEKNQAKSNIKKMIHNVYELKMNTIILHVRPSTDAIYKSKIFPTSIYVESKEENFDILQFFLEEAHSYHIKVIAWLNPYRILTTEDTSLLPKSSPAIPYLGTNTIFIKKGVYWNPSKKEVTDLIVKGVEEVLNYKVDGILFDDYFYPDKEIDREDYEEYLKNHSYLTIEEYHLEVINQMIEQVHTICKKYHIKFGISPDGNIENNYKIHYADVKKWLNSDKYIDFIMPQIYYGFYNSTKGYLKVAKEWSSLIKNNNIDFYIALAFYKIGKEDYYAKDGLREWIENDDIIMREVILSRNLENYKGFSLFRYDNVFNMNVNDNSKLELENLKRIIK